MNTAAPLSRIFQYQLNKDSYDIHLNATQMKLIITINKKTTVPNKKYEAFFTLEELIAKSKWFRIFETVEEVVNEMCSLFNESPFKLSEESNLINFIFSPSLKSSDEVVLFISELEAKQEEKFPELCATVNQLSKELSILERKFHIIENDKEYKKYFTQVQ